MQQRFQRVTQSCHPVLESTPVFTKPCCMGKVSHKPERVRKGNGLFPHTHQIVVGLLQLCIWKEASFLSSFTNACRNPKQGLHFLSAALILGFSREPSARPFSCTWLSWDGKEIRSRAGLSMLRLVLPSATAPLQRDQASTGSQELVWNPWE